MLDAIGVRNHFDYRFTEMYTFAEVNERLHDTKNGKQLSQKAVAFNSLHRSDSNQGDDYIAIIVSLISGFLHSKNLKFKRTTWERYIYLTIFINFSRNTVQKLLKLGLKTKCNVESTSNATFLKIQVSCST